MSTPEEIRKSGYDITLVTLSLSFLSASIADALFKTDNHMTAVVMSCVCFTLLVLSPTFFLVAVKMSHDIEKRKE